MGIVHCDLQPETVMIVDASGAAAAVKIMDFGPAEVVDSGTSAARLNHHHRPGSLTQKRRIIHEGSQAVGRAPYQFRNSMAWRLAPSGRDAGASDSANRREHPGWHAARGSSPASGAEIRACRDDPRKLRC